ncbi:patatin-like phospholipase [Citrobacter koseri]|uniref:Patatin-like phospholipase n=1 Tax=Citrobacter koseri TaxID=545 RepID=A0A2X2WQR2_CITKO|nr:patatin-like phospholipase [Citrobacter koseri]
MDLSWRRGGLLRGERVFNQYRNVMPVLDFEQCTRRFGTVATNLSTGRELWFTEGDLHLAVRASCSMPGLMSPVAHNGYWLVDGAVVNPVPVSSDACDGRRYWLLRSIFSTMRTSCSKIFCL